MSETIALSVTPLQQIAPMASAFPVTASHDAACSDYEVWQEFYDCRDAAWKQAAEAELASLARRWPVSVIVPTYNTPERWLRRCIGSVREQVYPDWELCIAEQQDPYYHVDLTVESTPFTSAYPLRSWQPPPSGRALA